MEESIFRNLLIPFYYNVYKRSNRLEYLKKLKKRDFLSSEDLYFIQWKRLKNLIDHCYHNIPYYGELFKIHDIHPEDIKSMDDYKKIPELNKSIILENMEKLTNPKLNKKDLSVTYTSGSTGMPAKMSRSIEDHEYACALKARSNSWCGWNYWNKSYWLITDRRYIKQLDTLKGRLSLWGNRKKMANTKNVCPTIMYSWVKEIKKFKPQYLYGYSSLLAEFSRFIIDERITLEGIKGIFSTAEPLTQRSLISRAFNAPVYDQYGCTEIPCIAHECTKGNMHINIDEVLVEFEDIEDDFETKKLICTPLYLYGMPLLRYNAYDTAVFTDKSGNCDCGLPYPTIELKVGRMSDNLLSTNGKLVSGIALCSYITFLTSGIKQFQIVQKDLSNIKINLTSSNDSKDDNEQHIRKILSELMETNLLKINFEYHEKIPTSKNGKFRPVISNVTNNLNYKENIRSKNLHVYQ